MERHDEGLIWFDAREVDGKIVDGEMIVCCVDWEWEKRKTRRVMLGVFEAKGYGCRARPSVADPGNSRLFEMTSVEICCKATNFCAPLLLLRMHHVTLFIESERS